MKIEICSEAVRILNKLSEEMGVELALAGGAVRDMLHGLPYKDLDLEIIGSISHIKVEEICLLILGQYKGSDISVQYGKGEAGTDNRLIFVFEVTIEGKLVNVIYRHVESIDDLFNSYDMSLNQVAIFKNQVVVHPDFLSNPVKSTGKLITRERLDKFEDKFPEYDFSLVEKNVVGYDL